MSIVILSTEHGQLVRSKVFSEAVNRTSKLCMEVTQCEWTELFCYLGAQSNFEMY